MATAAVLDALLGDNTSCSDVSSLEICVACHFALTSIAISNDSRTHNMVRVKHRDLAGINNVMM